MEHNMKKQVSNRWKSIEGHVWGIGCMVDEKPYGIDRIKQAVAVQGAPATPLAGGLGGVNRGRFDGRR